MSGRECTYLVFREHGVGIDPADHARIFERFERDRRSLHGSIRVESSRRAGARFIMELPRGEPALH